MHLRIESLVVRR